MLLGNTHFGWALNQLFDGRKVCLPEWCDGYIQLNEDQTVIMRHFADKEAEIWAPMHKYLLSRDWQAMESVKPGQLHKASIY